MFRLTLERKKKGLTKAKLGALTNIHPVEIGKMESGRIKPYDAWKKRLEKFLKIPAEELFEEVKDDEEQ